MSNPVLRWPPDPYKGLAYYGPEDSLLFAGRNEDIDACVHFLAEPATRLLLLHGRTGCGKSSFLRAGLIPALEERGFGFQFLRTATEQFAGGEPVFIRCGDDPISRIAEQLFVYVDVPHLVRTAKGPQVRDLSAAKLGHRSLEAFTSACRTPGTLLAALAQLSRALLHTLVIILDQAEEVITLTQPLAASRRDFFQFLQDFSTTPLDVKFVVALRKEHFGEFFSYTQLDASVKTDIKQFLLSDLEPHEVLDAIELPTSRTPIGEAGAPHDVYHFDFAPGLAEQITRDLFEATPSGGVLPVMQIVCRNLLNEARPRPGATIIDAALYHAGDKVAGRVDRHLSTALRESFVTAPLPPRDPAEEERRWREVLYHLVIRDADGTVKSASVSAPLVRKHCEDEGVTVAIDHVLAKLASADTLVLRQFSNLNVDEVRRETLYSLGHDAIGLALHEWRLRREESARRTEEAARRAAAERQARLRLRWVWMAGAAAVGIAVGAFLTVDYFRTQAHLTELQSLEAAVLRLKRTDPRLAVAAAVEGVARARDFSSLWPNDAGAALATQLAELLRDFPMTVTRTDAGADPLRGTRSAVPLLLRPGFVFPRHDPNAVEIVTVDPPSRTSITLPPVAPGDPDPVDFIQDLEPGVLIYLAPSGARLARAEEVAVPDEPDPRKDGVTLIVDGAVFGTYDQDYFLRKARPAGETRSLYVTGGQVQLVQSHLMGLSRVDAFTFDRARPREDPFVLQGWFAPAAEVLAGRNLSGVGGTLLAFDIAQRSAEAQPVGWVPGFKGLVAYDLHKPNGGEAWRQETDISVLGSCVRRAHDSAPQNDATLCEVQLEYSSTGAARLALLRVTFQREPIAGAGAAAAVESKQPDVIVILDPRTGRTRDVMVSALNELRDKSLSPEVSTAAESRQVASATFYGIGGTIESPVLAVVDGPVVDLFDFRQGHLRLLTTLRAPEPIGRFALSVDGTIGLTAGYTYDGYWRIPSEPPAPATATAPDALVIAACQRGLVPDNIDRGLWYGATGLTEPPSRRCSPNPPAASPAASPAPAGKDRSP